jgi:CBS domain-containing protein
VSKVVAWLMFAVGIFLVVQGDIINGVWLGAIAYFLHSAASQSAKQMVLEARLGKVQVRDVARPVEVTVMPGTSVAELVEGYMLPRNLRAVPVTDNGRLVGVVTIGDVMRVPLERRAGTAVAEVMSGFEHLYTVSADSCALDAVELLEEHDLEQVPVLDNGQLVGMLTRADVMRQLQMREELTPNH